MSKVRVRKKSLVIDGRSTYLRSGDISYFRTPKESWKERLDNAKKCYLNSICTYVPWFWHEQEEGQFDFTGKTHPEKDLVRFIELIGEADLYLIIRPGPFINAEFRYGGHPEWMFRKYPQVWSRNADGKPALWLGHGVPVPSQLHPKYLNLVELWYENVIPILAKYSINNGGPIILSQPDNEMNLIYTFSLTQSLYDPHIIGDNKEKGLWHDWLLEKYGDLPAIRERYCEAVRFIGEISPPRDVANDTITSRKISDWLDFKEWHIFTFAEHLVKLFHKHGLSVPFTMNEPNCFLFKGGDHAAASYFLKEYEGQYFTTGHLYLTGGEQDIFGVPMTLFRLELVKLFDFEGPTVEAELGLGWCDLKRNRAHYNFDLLTRLALGHGMDGYNFYMFSGGYNPQGSNAYGRDYNWNAPIQSDGSLHPTYYMARRFGKWIAGWEQKINDTEKEFDFYLCLSNDLSYRARWIDKAELLNPASNDIFGHDTVQTTSSQDAYDGMLEVVQIMTTFQLHFQLLNLSYLPNNRVQDKPLIVPCGGWLPAQAFDFLKERIQSGISVLFYPSVPYRDSDGNLREEFLEFIDLSMLKEQELGTPGMEPFRPRFLTVEQGEIKEISVDRGIHCFDSFGKADILASFENKAVAFKKSIGKASVVVMGLYPSYLTYDSQTLFKSILVDAINLRPHVKSKDDILHTVIRRRKNEKSLLLTAANIYGFESLTQIEIDLDDQKLVFPLKTKLEIAPKHIYNYWINLDLGYATLIYSTVEMYPENEEMTLFTIRGCRMASGELAFDRPVHVEVDGQEKECINHKGLYIVTFVSGREDSKLSITAA